MDMSSPFYVMESEIDYKPKEAKKIKKEKAQPTNQDLKLPTELGHFGRSLRQTPKLPRMQKIKRHSVPKG